MIDSADVGLTVTVQEADRAEPSLVVAVMVASPTETAVTRPFSSTEATQGSEETHDTDLSGISSGSTVAVSFTVSPTSREAFS